MKRPEIHQDVIDPSEAAYCAAELSTPKIDFEPLLEERSSSTSLPGRVAQGEKRHRENKSSAVLLSKSASPSGCFARHHAALSVLGVCVYWG